VRIAPPPRAVAVPVPDRPLPAPPAAPLVAPLVAPLAAQLVAPAIARGGGFRGGGGVEAPAGGDVMDMSMSAGTIEQLHRMASSHSSLSGSQGGATSLGNSGCLDPNLLDLNDLSLSHDTIEAIARAGRERMADGPWGPGDGR